MSSPKHISFRQLAKCSVCKQPMFYPVFWGCKQHLACYRCMHNTIEINKQVVLDLSQATGVTETHECECPECDSICHHDMNSMATSVPPVEWVKKFHSMRNDACSAMCPFCFDYCLLDIKEGYEHLSACKKRPILCKMCRQHIHAHSYTEHLTKFCTGFICTSTLCTDGSVKSMTLSKLRTHMMSHNQYECEIQNARQQIEQVLVSIPHGTEAERLKFPQICAVAIQGMIDAIKKTR